MFRSSSLCLPPRWLVLALRPSPRSPSRPRSPRKSRPSVPALDAMHEVIMPMWHEAWPNKDYKALAALVPDIEKHVAAISKAELPGILRDKKAAWEAGVDD